MFLADIKGDLSGIAKQGVVHEKITERIEKIHISNFDFRANPTGFGIFLPGKAIRFERLFLI